MSVGTLMIGGALGAVHRYGHKVRVITSEPTINSEPVRQLLDFIDCFRMTSRAYVPCVRNNRCGRKRLAKTARYVRHARPERFLLFLRVGYIQLRGGGEHAPAWRLGSPLRSQETRR
jgi:hypothetical protein